MGAFLHIALATLHTTLQAPMQATLQATLLAQAVVNGWFYPISAYQPSKNETPPLKMSHQPPTHTHNREPV